MLKRPGKNSNRKAEFHHERPAPSGSTGNMTLLHRNQHPLGILQNFPRETLKNSAPPILN